MNLQDRSSNLLVENLGVLRSAITAVRARLNFHIDAWVVLPEHMHCIWTLPFGDADYPARWRMIKAGFSKRVASREPVSNSRLQKGECGIWQRRYWEHTARDAADYAAHVDYVHFNPMKHGHVNNARDWPHSTFHQFVARGMYPQNWGSAP